MNDRDRKLLKLLAPLAVFALYWLLLMNPALDRRSALQEPLSQAQETRDEAIARAGEVEAAHRRYESDYAELVKLSKAIPSNVAVSDLMRELNAAAHGTGISFSNISMAGGADDEAAEAASGPTVAEGLDEIPVELTFDGRFFGLADLFRRVQHFVTVADGQIEVHGRLIRIDGFAFDSATFPDITARISATIYAAPVAEGATGGATPVGPRGAERGDGGLSPVQSFAPATAVSP